MSSKFILASSASTSPAPVTTSGLISTIEASRLDEGLVHRQHELGRGADLLALEAEAEGELAGVESLHAGDGIDGDLEDLLGVLRRDLLDLHAAFGRGHHGDRATVLRSISMPR